MKKRTSYPTKWINGKQVRVHRIVMAKHLGRDLTSNELVHHKDKNVYNNEIKNLVLTTRSEHKKLHPEIGEQNRFKQKYFLDKDKLKKLYVDQRISIRQISFKLRIPENVLLRLRDKYKLKQKNVYCEKCGEPARYIKAKRCYKCYQAEWHKRNN